MVIDTIKWLLILSHETFASLVWFPFANHYGNQNWNFEKTSSTQLSTSFNSTTTVTSKTTSEK